MNLNQSLFDIIGILIAFLSILLLLSLVVTSLVQTFQAGLRLRARNLKHGLQSLIKSGLGKEAKEAGDLALKILNASNICIIGRKQDPTAPFSRLLGPAISYIDPKELPKAFKEAGAELVGDLEKHVLYGFEKMWNQLENRFLFRIRMLTIGCSLIVAGYFQISAPALLSHLSVNKSWQAQIVNDAGSLTGTPPGVPLNYDDLAFEALKKLGAEFPEIKAKLEKVSGLGGTKALPVPDLKLALADSGPIADKAVARYEALLDQLYTERKDKADKERQAALDKLSKYDISGWPQGKVFYFKSGSVQWANVVGVLVTAILLSFGAPFWFERLKEVLKFKDMLSKGIKPEDEKGGKGKPQRAQTGGSG